MPQHPLIDALNTVIQEESAVVQGALAGRPPEICLAVLGYVAVINFRRLPEHQRMEAFEKWTAINRRFIEAGCP